jgi:Fur family ferric uptake transcriptional regulator
VISVDVEEAGALVKKLADNHAFVPDLGHLTVFGRCEECQQ